MVADHEPLPPVLLDATEERTLGYYLARLVELTPDRVLALSILVGLVGASALVVWAPTWRRALPLFGLLIAFGVWGIARHERSRTGAAGLVVQGVRTLALIAGAASIIALTISVFEVMVGKLIS